MMTVVAPKHHEGLSDDGRVVAPQHHEGLSDGGRMLEGATATPSGGTLAHGKPRRALVVNLWCQHR